MNIQYRCVGEMFVESVDGAVYENHSVSGTVYLTIDSQPKIGINFSKLIEVRVVFNTALKSEAVSDHDIHNDVVEAASPLTFDVETKEQSDHVPLEDKDKKRYSISNVITTSEDPSLAADHVYEIPLSNSELPSKKSKNDPQHSNAYGKSVSLDQEKNDKLRCNMCMAIFSSEELFESHITADRGSHECKLCFKTFPFEGYLLAHMSVYHHRNSKMQSSKDGDLSEDLDCTCHLCERHFQCLSDLQQHMCAHTLDNCFKCCLCGKELQAKFDKIHMFSEHGKSVETMQKHSLAKKKVKEEKEVRIFKKNRESKDLYVTHGKGYSCKMCKKNFRTKAQFRSHIRADGISHKCDSCEEQFPFQAYLLAHKNMNHMFKEDEVGQSKQKKARCHLCFYTGTSIHQLRKHMVVHTKEDFFQCCVCNETVKELRSLRLHIGYHMKFNSENSMEDWLKPLDEMPQEGGQNEVKDKDISVLSDGGNECEIYSSLNRETAHSRARQCGFCKKIFHNKRLFDKHFMAKTCRYKCDDCDVVFPTKAYLYAHISLSHTADKKALYVCHICEHVTKKWVELRAHMITHTDEYSFKCCICQQPIRRRKALSRHMKKHKDYFISQVKLARGVRGESSLVFPESSLENTGEDVECEVCSRDFQTMEAYEQHFRPEPETQKCDLCDQTFLHKNDKMIHISLDHHRDTSSDNKAKTKPKCHVCGEVSTLGRLIHHMITHTGEPVYKCCVCGKAMSSKIDTRHTRLHSKGGMVQCSCCNQLFSSMRDVVKHRNSVKGIHCSFCGKSFINITGRNMHYRIAHPDKILQCLKCSRIFSCQEELNSHMKYHDTHKKKECPICGKFFSVLKLHLLTHRPSVDENEMYHCDQCPKRFIRLSSFRYHKMSHNKVTQFKCHLCIKSLKTVTAYRAHLKRHMTHIGWSDILKDSEEVSLSSLVDLRSEVQFCRLCSKGFVSKHVLATHMKDTHSILNVAVENRVDEKAANLRKSRTVLLSSDETMAEPPLKVTTADKDYNYHS